jgi:sigma-E factor negative regulatory protein RseB
MTSAGAPAKAFLALGAGALLAVLGAGVVRAQEAEALGWLRRIYDATQKLPYTGTFVYQQGDRTETSRITRYVHPGGGDIEKLEVLDGVPREIVRTRDVVKCYLPDRRVVKVDRRSVERGFPALLPERISVLAQHYTVGLGELRRVAGFESQAVVLRPKDDLRYGYRLWADTGSGMLLKAVTLDGAGQPVEQFTFTQLSMGHVSRDKVRPRRDARDWRVEDAAATPANLTEAGWSVSLALPGFRKVIELRRRLGESRPAGQLVYSDGLAAISVFIESLEGRAEPVRAGLARLGAIHIYRREVANHMVTVVGEAPAVSVQRIADAVEFRKPQ